MLENQLSVYDFVQPFGGALDRDNRWIRLAEQLDWHAMEEQYAACFGQGGAQALPLRMAFGSLVIREALGLSDRQTVLLIGENPYLQYFIGLSDFTAKVPFAAHSMSTFRKRIPEKEIQRAVRQLNRLSRAERKR